MDLQSVLKDPANNLVPYSASMWKCLTPAVEVVSHSSFIIFLKAVWSNEYFTVRSWGITNIVPVDSKALTVFTNYRHLNLNIRREIKSNWTYIVSWNMKKCFDFTAAQTEHCEAQKQQPGTHYTLPPESPGCPQGLQHLAGGTHSALATTSHLSLSRQEERSNFSCRVFPSKNLSETSSDAGFTEGNATPYQSTRENKMTC